MGVKEVYIIPWRDRRNGLSHGIKPGCFTNRDVAIETAQALAKADTSLIFIVEAISIFDEIPTTWFGPGGKGCTS